MLSARFRQIVGTATVLFAFTAVLDLVQAQSLAVNDLNSKAKTASNPHQAKDELDGVFEGTWSYRSFHSNPDLEVPPNDLLFGAGTLRLNQSSNTTLDGSLGGDGWSLALRGSADISRPPQIRFQGTGTIGGEEWIYDYVGYLIPNWPNGIDQRPAIVGSIVRTKEHSSGRSKAGYVAQWIAVKSDQAAEKATESVGQDKRIESKGSEVRSSLVSSELWREPQDTVAALTETDRYAWRLFVALNWPAVVEKREADPNEKFGENKTTVWESWKLSSGPNDEVFLANGVNPGNWLPGRSNKSRKLQDLESLPLQQRERFKSRGQKFDPSIPVGRNENHMNQTTYEFIVGHDLYNVEGQEAVFQKAEELFEKANSDGRIVDLAEFRMDFPQNAKEVKAQWRPIEEKDKDRYRWEEFTDDQGQKHIYGLTALHITTKDLPNWLWATFEHIDNPSRPNAEQWIIPSRDRASGASGIPGGLGIENTRWQYYRLRGTQSEFVNPIGQPTILANSQVEQGFQTSSSCITCHARATIGPKLRLAANRLSIFAHEYGDTVEGSVGNLEESLFVRRSFSNPGAGELQYMPLDFVWSFMRAKRKSEFALTKTDIPGFDKHIKPLFRPKDINAMRRFFDLGKYDDVKSHAKEILSRLKDGSMPCDGEWPSDSIKLFEDWIQGGFQQ